MKFSVPNDAFSLDEENYLEDINHYLYGAFQFDLEETKWRYLLPYVKDTIDKQVSQMIKFKDAQVIEELVAERHEQPQGIEAAVSQTTQKGVFSRLSHGFLRTATATALLLAASLTPIGMQYKGVDINLNPIVGTAEAVMFTDDGFNVNEWLVLNDFKLPKKFAMFHYGRVGRGACLGMAQTSSGEIIPTHVGSAGNKPIIYVNTPTETIPTYANPRGTFEKIFVKTKNGETIPTYANPRGTFEKIFVKTKNGEIIPTYANPRGTFEKIFVKTKNAEIIPTYANPRGTFGKIFVSTDTTTIPTYGNLRGANNPTSIEYTNSLEEYKEHLARYNQEALLSAPDVQEFYQMNQRGQKILTTAQDVQERYQMKERGEKILRTAQDVQERYQMKERGEKILRIAKDA